jgi:pimeloyl-ACP methyl ester carboxylesterase
VFACAQALPDRVFGGLAMCSIGPREAWNETTREALEAAANNPEQSEQQLQMFPMMVENDRAGLIKSLLDQVPATFRDVAESKPELLEAFVDHHVEGQRQGAKATLYEQELFIKPWGFELENIKAPIRIWCGANDLLVTDAQFMADKLPNREIKIQEGAGHIDLIWLTDELLGLLKELDPRTQESHVSD